MHNAHNRVSQIISSCMSVNKFGDYLQMPNIAVDLSKSADNMETKEKYEQN